MSEPSSHPGPTAAELEEVDLLEALRRGDDSAYEQLVREQGGRMLSVIRRILGNEEDARDAVQEAFLQVFKSIDRFEGQSKLSTWLHRIAVNAALMRLRKQRRRQEVSIDSLLPAFVAERNDHFATPNQAWAQTADQIAQTQEARQQVRELIDQLPEDYRTVLLLRDIEEMDTNQTSDILEISPGAVKTRLHRARQALRTLLDPYMKGDA